MSRGDAIVILGCALVPNGQPSPTLERRLREGLAAWRQGDAHEIWVCGGRRWWGIAEASAMAAWLVEHQVPAERILVESCSLTTRENAWYCRRAAERRGQDDGIGRYNVDEQGGSALGGGQLGRGGSVSNGFVGAAPGSAESDYHGQLGATPGAESGTGSRELRIVLVTCDFHISRARHHFTGQGFVCSVRAAVTPRTGTPTRLRFLGQSLRSAFVFLFALR